MFQVQYDSFHKWTHFYEWDKWRHLGLQLVPETLHMASKTHTHYFDMSLQYLKRTDVCADRMCSAETEFSGLEALLKSLEGLLSTNSFLKVESCIHFEHQFLEKIQQRLKIPLTLMWQERIYLPQPHQNQMLG